MYRNQCFKDKNNKIVKHVYFFLKLLITIY